MSYRIEPMELYGFWFVEAWIDPTPYEDWGLSKTWMNWRVVGPPDLEALRMELIEFAE